MTDVAAFPLCWPEGWPRTAKRAADQFQPRTVYQCAKDIGEALAKMGATEPIVSTSVPLRKVDGLPLAKPPVDGDPGAAVYFVRRGKSQCIAIDRYKSVEANLRAIFNTLEAMRTIERHGGAEILDRAFTGFAALPQNAGNKRPWWEVLGCFETSSETVVEGRYRVLAKAYGPDMPQEDNAKMVEINLARDEWRATR